VLSQLEAPSANVRYMTTKMILCWDILPGAESEYFEFMVSEFIPGLKRLGINDPGVWYTAYGEAEQILVSGTTETSEHMAFVLRSTDWVRLKERLETLVDNFSQRVLPATGGFQL
jgi:hypothetical protein